MIVFKDILDMLSKSGWSAYRLRKENVLSESTITRLRNKEPINTTTIDKLCGLCKCQPGDLMRYVSTEKGE